MINCKKEGFFERVYELVRLIPCGRVTSYGSIARYLGTGRSARMVGWALKASHSCGSYVPAHRVVNCRGLLTGKQHFDTPGLMQQLLENEGIIVDNDRVVNFREKFWDPSVELENKQEFCRFP